MMESHDSSFPLRRPFSTTLMPSGAIVMVYVLSPCASSRLIDLSSLVAIGCLAVETIRAKLAREHQRCQWRRVYRYMAVAAAGDSPPSACAVPRIRRGLAKETSPKDGTSVTHEIEDQT